MPKSFQMLSCFFLVLSTIAVSLTSAGSHTFSRTMSRGSLGLQEEKVTHLHFYFHDTVSGKNPTAVPVARSSMTNTSKTFFGVVMVMDDPLTVEPEIDSKPVGRAQGIYASTSLTDVSLLMTFNFAFTEGTYNGSNLSVLGRNSVFSGIRELPIVGGNGVFRFARGYAQAKTYQFDPRTGDAVVEYDVYVSHY